MRWSTIVTLNALCAFVALGCGSDPKEPPTAPTGGTEGPTANATDDGAGNKKPGDDPNKSQIRISDEIKKACGITDVDAHFAFDSANIRESDHRILGQLSTCFTSGPLAGRQMNLVGHTDPRGEPEYNMLLGGRRSENVKGFLVQKGMATDKVDTTSRGELDASGTDEASWLTDRRVDVMLGN
jgi:peptidoglycan-associated lipoprotein